MNIDEETRAQIIQVVSGILHLGNIKFVEVGNDAAQPEDDQCMYFFKPILHQYTRPSSRPC